MSVLGFGMHGTGLQAECIQVAKGEFELILGCCGWEFCLFSGFLRGFFLGGGRVDGIFFHDF